MIKHSYISRTSRLLARIWGSLVVGFVLYFLLVHIFSQTPESITALEEPGELISFVFFPVLTIAGLLLAFKSEGWGGLIASLAILSALFLNEALDFKFLLLFFPPGALYLVYWYVSKKERQVARRMKLH